MANSDFKITSEQTQSPDGKPVTIFYLRGWLDAQSDSALFSAAEEVHIQGARHIVLQLEDVSILTSAGIRALQKIYKLFLSSDSGEPKTGLKLCNDSPQVYHALSVTGFLHTVPMYENLQAALASL